MTVVELLGIAMGRMGMSYGDFCSLTPGEFSTVYKEYEEATESHERSEWERMRILAAVNIQPHVKKKITPRRLIPLPWDERPKRKTASSSLSKDERSRILERRLKECGW